MPKRDFNENRGENESKKKQKYDGGVGCKTIKGTVVLTKKKNLLDRLLELVKEGVSLQLISAEHGDPGKLGEPSYLKKSEQSDSEFKVTFDWDEKKGVPGAFIIKNKHRSKFYLKTVTLEDVPGQGRIHFDCNSWVYPADKYKYNRVFFTNQTYLPSQTPVALQKYREEELVNLRGNGSGELERWDRVYDYAKYNDLGDEKDETGYLRPVLGGSTKYPYPRRGRTGRKLSKNDPRYERRLDLVESLEIYVPRDEQFDHTKLLDVLSFGLKAIIQFLPHELQAQFEIPHNEFKNFQQVLELYQEGIKLPNSHLLKEIRKHIPCKMLKKLVRSSSEKPFNFPTPQVIKEDKSAWRTDKEFAREMLAGVNPVVIRRLQEFPPASKLDPEVYGNQTSSITEKDIGKNLYGSIKPETKKRLLTIDEAIKNNRLFILDHHDALMPYLRRINSTTTKTYATRTLLFLKDNGTMKPLAIELSLPHRGGDRFGAVSEVYTPAEHGVEGSIWQLAKAYVAVNDSGYHQLISHWLNTHAVIEPFVIATNRQLSVVHPIYKLLHPHFRDTMHINALARQILINANGVLEYTVFPAKYSMEMSASLYKDWVFPDQALPTDLIKRGMAVEDSESHHSLRLLIEDYPYAVDGLEIWSAIETWVQDYCSLYYKTDEMVQNDQEVQLWWKELREEGHGDKKNEPWWPEMQTIKELTKTCTIIIWVASALHAAVNFGQYPYAGYLPNRPTISRQLLPEQGSDEYNKLNSEFDKVFFKTITSQLQTLIGISLIEILSTHSSDEVYLGQRAPGWTSNEKALKALEKFGEELKKVEKRIKERNEDEKLRNRVGPVKMKYTLLCPSSESGLTGKGIPNSVSI